MSRDIVNATKVKPGTTTPNKLDFKVYCAEAVSQYDVLYISGVRGAFYQVNKAINTTAAQTTGMLLMARSAGASGRFIRATALGMIKNKDTSGDSVGDAYYLGSTAGAVSKTTVGFARRVGYVAKAATVVNGGQILFNGFSQVSAGSNIIAGTATFASGQATVTVLQATLGGAVLGGKPVVATFNSTDTTNTILSATWSTNDLVITRTTGSATTPTVAYFIQAS